MSISLKKVLIEAGIWGQAFNNKDADPHQKDGIPDKLARDLAQKLSRGIAPSTKEWQIYLSVLNRNFDYDDAEVVYKAGKASNKLTPDQFKQIAQVLDKKYGRQTDISKDISKMFGGPF